MAEMYRKTHRTIALERKRERCAKMRAAKERKRMAYSEAAVECGGLLTWGSLGCHDIRLLAYPDDVRHVAITVDGRHRQARTLRGIVRCMGEMICSQMEARP